MCVRPIFAHPTRCLKAFERAFVRPHAHPDSRLGMALRRWTRRRRGGRDWGFVQLCQWWGEEEAHACFCRARIVTVTGPASSLTPPRALKHNHKTTATHHNHSHAQAPKQGASSSGLRRWHRKKVTVFPSLFKNQKDNHPSSDHHPRRPTILPPPTHPTHAHRSPRPCTLPLRQRQSGERARADEDDDNP